MTETNLTQAEADALMAMEKHRVNEELNHAATRIQRGLFT